jgi:hypothetical protein
MIAENHLRGIMILVALSVLGCAPSVGRVEPTLSSAHPIPTPGCPYANVYVAVSTDGSTKDKRIAERVRLAYSEFLGEQGFSVAAAPEEAYWSAFSMVHLSPRIDSTFAWTVYVMATQDLQGRIQTPIDFSGEGEGETELSGFMLLREVQLLELDLQAQQAAADTAGALLPHAFRMCVAWNTKPKEEVAPQTEEPGEEIVQVEQEEDDLLKSLREELNREITRIRRERTKRQQRKELEIEAGELSGL